MDELTIGDKIYISSKRAAEITGYAKDYVGQLCREGRVEATLVGRSWYVLETSIRDHRFGGEESVSAPKSDGRPSSAVSEWESPKYEPEEVVEVPQIEKSPINVLEQAEEPEVEEVPAPKAQASVEDMQSAWKEWFATRNREKLIETPDIIDARAEEDEVYADDEVVAVENEVSDEEEVQIRRVPNQQVMRQYDPIPSTPEIEKPVRINKQPSISYASPVPMRPTAPSKRGETARVRSGGGLALRALLISLALLAVAVAVIGTGNAENVIGDEARVYEPIKFLGGTRIIDK